MFSRVSVPLSQMLQLVHRVHLHTPVMKQEVLDILNPKSGQKFLDMTFGAGGHSKELLNFCTDLTVYGLDRDPFAYELAMETASEIQDSNLFPLLGKFSDLPQQLKDVGVKQNYFDGILIDCGCSSMQFDNSVRGFSISKDGPLDMRMDKDRIPNQPSAADILAHIDEVNLARVLKIYGEEQQARKIARSVVEARYLFKRLKTTTELAQLVEAACGFSSRSDKLQRSSHVATKTFQALRILVNDELTELDFAIKVAAAYLKPKGKLIAISFHSLEDRILKSHLTGYNYSDEDGQKYNNYGFSLDAQQVESAMKRRWQPINKHVLVPSDDEIYRNPRSRSAKLRAAIKTS